MIGGGAVLGLGLYGFAPLAMRLLLGGEFEPAIEVLRILSALPLVLSITYSVGFQWLLPFGKDALINRIILAAGLINLTLSFLLARPYGHIGMAWAVLSAEVFVAASMVVAVWRAPAAWVAPQRPPSGELLT